MLVINVISIHFNCLSPGMFILLQPLNHVNLLIGGTMHDSKTSTEAPSQCRPSIGRVTVWAIEDKTPEPILNKHDTQTWPLNQPTGKHKQTSFEFSLHQGHGWWKPCFSDQIMFKLILPKMLCWNQPPGEPGRKKAPHAQPSSILEDCNCSQNWDVDKKKNILAQGTLGLVYTFLAACVHCVCCWSLDTPETCHSDSET